MEVKEEQPNGKVNQPSFILSCSWGSGQTPAEWKGEAYFFSSELFSFRRRHISLGKFLGEKDGYLTNLIGRLGNSLDRSQISLLGGNRTFN